VDSSTGVHWSPVLGATLAEHEDHRLNLGLGPQTLFALLYGVMLGTYLTNRRTAEPMSWRLLESIGVLELSDLQSIPVRCLLESTPLESSTGLFTGLE
jgi:hypothetical protein